MWLKFPQTCFSEGCSPLSGAGSVLEVSLLLFSLQQSEKAWEETGLNNSPVGVARETRAMRLCSERWKYSKSNDLLTETSLEMWVDEMPTDGGVT